MTIQDKLCDFIERASGDCVWGVSDCCTWPAKWLQEAHGLQIKIPRYSSEEDAMAMVSIAGSLRDLCGPILERAGCYETGYPRYGDVGIVQLSKSQVAVIFVDNGIAYWRATKGAIAIHARKNIVAAWSVP